MCRCMASQGHNELTNMGFDMEYINNARPWDPFN